MRGKKEVREKEREGGGRSERKGVKVVKEREKKVKRKK